MDQFIQRVSDLLKQHFVDGEVDLGPASGDRISGFLIWDGFQEDEQIDRQRAVSCVLRANLDANELLALRRSLPLPPRKCLPHGQDRRADQRHGKTDRL